MLKKAMKGTLAVTTLGASVAAEKGAKAAAAGIAGKIATTADLTPEQIERGIVFYGKSHDEGRNADVTLYVDRIERIRERSRMSMSKAKQDTEMTPIKSVTSVQAKKDGSLYTKVTVYASGNNIDFRFRHDAAQQFKEAIQELILTPTSPAVAPAAAAAATPDLAEQLKKLAELRDAGVLTEEEFAAKKTDLLARM